MRGRRGPRTAVRIVGSRARGNFLPHMVGSSTRIGVCPFVVIGAPTVRLAEIVGVGCVAVAAAAAAAITMRLRGRAAASGRPPPAVWAVHCSRKECRPLPGHSSKNSRKLGSVLSTKGCSHGPALVGGLHCAISRISSLRRRPNIPERVASSERNLEQSVRRLRSPIRSQQAWHGGFGYVALRRSMVPLRSWSHQLAGWKKSTSDSAASVCERR